MSHEHIYRPTIITKCACGHIGEPMSLDEALYMLGVPRHDAPPREQEARSARPEAKPDSGATESKTEAGNAKKEEQMGMTVWRWDGKLVPDAPTHVIERWEPCAGEHVETKDGRWWVQIYTSGAHETVEFCDGKHRRMVNIRQGTDWERKVS